MILTVFLLGVVGPPAACQPINADKILGRDLASAAALFSALPPDLEIGYAPAPGHQRTFTRVELERLLERHTVEATVEGPICFEWTMEMPASDAIAAAMKQSLNEPAEIEIVETSRYPAPRGQIVFPLSGLSSRAARAAETVMWRGFVQYGSEKRFDIWARAKIKVPYVRVVAAEALRAGKPVGPEQVRLESGSGPPLAAGTASHIEDVIGLIPRRSFAAGEVVLASALDRPLDVSRGDIVRVEVRSGNARIETEGRAEASGRAGDTIPVLNPDSRKVFRARIQSPGKVALVTGGS